MTQIEDATYDAGTEQPNAVERFLNGDFFTGILHSKHLPVSLAGIVVLSSYAVADGAIEHIDAMVGTAEDEQELSFGLRLGNRAFQKIDDIQRPELRENLGNAAGIAVIGYARFRGFIEDVEDLAGDLAFRGLGNIQQ